jgi:hypothetical protein
MSVPTCYDIDIVFHVYSSTYSFALLIWLLVYIVIHLDIGSHVYSHTFCFSRTERKATQDHAQALFSFLNTHMKEPLLFSIFFPPSTSESSTRPRASSLFFLHNFFFSPATSEKLYKTTRKPFFFPRVEPMETRGVGRGGGGRRGAGS